jgi:hypothetical protein
MNFNNFTSLFLQLVHNLMGWKQYKMYNFCVTTIYLKNKQKITTKLIIGLPYMIFLLEWIR